MRRTEKPVCSAEERALYTEAEANANLFNLKCLAVLCVFIVFSVILNEIGVFKAPRTVMHLSAFVSMFLLLIPIAVAAIHDKLLKRQPRIVERPSFKHLIVVTVYIGIGLLCVTLSFHAVALLAVPPLIASQYRNERKLTLWVLVATLLLVPIGVYGAFFLGMADRNFIKGMLTDEEAANLASRLTIATPKRMGELFLHYAMPRMFCVVAIVALASGVTRRNRKMLERQAELNRTVKEEMQRTNELQSHVIDALATLIETRDVDTGEHVIRTKRYVRMIADKMKEDEKYRGRLTDEEIARIENAAPLHDVGKIAVSDTILLKPGKLTPEEFEKMKIHTVKGGDMIENIFAGMEDRLFLATAEEIAMSHHEKWDGSGYPRGLKGEEIPLSARIMAIADVYDALVSVRVYKAPIEPEAALDIMASESGTHFDPDLMRIVDGMRADLVRTAKLPLEDIR